MSLDSSTQWTFQTREKSCAQQTQSRPARLKYSQMYPLLAHGPVARDDPGWRVPTICATRTERVRRLSSLLSDQHNLCWSAWLSPCYQSRDPGGWLEAKSWVVADDSD